MTTSVLRLANLGDLDALVALEARFPGDRLNRRSFRHLLTRAHAEVWVALVDGDVAGNVVVVSRTGTNHARIYSLVVDPRYRGQGIGTRLIAAAERRAHACGHSAVQLEVRADNTVAVRLYEKAGFAVIGQITDYYDDGCSALKLRKTLPAGARRPVRRRRLASVHGVETTHRVAPGVGMRAGNKRLNA